MKYIITLMIVLASMATLSMAKITYEEIRRYQGEYEDGIGVGLGSCDNRYHNNTDLFVSLSTKWYNGGSRCGKTIVINSPNGHNVSAKVVSECATNDGCKDNVIVASDGVWHTLNIDRKSQKWGWMNVTWTDL
ncbi:hypothetical protein LIER_11358 [Lithospermum erythrorhizon]|uniref:Uncharacterized protein n=1 Tax=Lithospermum erythrorhizon TaxID=34254 RepID=A0AAV3PN33_LITER